MKVERVPIGSVRPDPENARLHGARNLVAIKASIQKFGQQRPIVVDMEGIVRAGNGTYEAMVSLGLVEVDVVRTELSSEEVKAYALADNRSGELADWNYEGLVDTLHAMEEREIPLADFGWAPHETDVLFNANFAPPPPPPPGPVSFSVMVTPAQRGRLDACMARAREGESVVLDETAAVERLLERFLGGA